MTLVIKELKRAGFSERLIMIPLRAKKMVVQILLNQACCKMKNILKGPSPMLGHICTLMMTHFILSISFSKKISVS